MFLFFSFNFLLTFMLACLVELSLVSFVCLFVVFFSCCLFVGWLACLFVCLLACLLVCFFAFCLFVYLIVSLFVCLFLWDNVLMRKRWTESFTNLTQHVPGGSLQSSCRSQNVPGAPPAASFLHLPYVHWPWQHWPFWVQATFSFRQWTQRNMWQYLPEK